MPRLKWSEQMETCWVERGWNKSVRSEGDEEDQIGRYRLIQIDRWQTYRRVRKQRGEYLRLHGRGQVSGDGRGSMGLIA